MIQAMTPASMSWAPRNGVNTAKTPAAAPSAIRCGEDGRRFRRKIMYWADRVQLRLGQKRHLRRSPKLAALARLNSIRFLRPWLRLPHGPAAARIPNARNVNIAAHLCQIRACCAAKILEPVTAIPGGVYAYFMLWKCAKIAAGPEIAPKHRGPNAAHRIKGGRAAAENSGG